MNIHTYVIVTVNMHAYLLYFLLSLGVGGSVALYAPIFVSNEVQGEQLLSFRADDLENLNIYSIGHQELILEAVAQLRNFVSSNYHILIIIHI